jgi:hypothetical protein
MMEYCPCAHEDAQDSNSDATSPPVCIAIDFGCRILFILQARRARKYGGRRTYSGHGDVSYERRSLPANARHGLQATNANVGGKGDPFSPLFFALAGRASFGHGGTAMTDSTGLTGQILLYRSEDGRTMFDVRLENATVWLNQRQLTELFGKAKGTISEHIKHIFEDGELADYFDELLTRIREIRASEARVYQRIREIFALASDYDESDQATARFFAFMQNKMHYGATGLTAAEIIRRRADAEKPNMGLTNWSGGRVLKRDVNTAKNYLDAKEIDTLNRIVVMFLDRAEFRAQRRRDIKMADWETDLDKFLVDTELPTLSGAGTVSHDDALDWAGAQYDAFAERRRADAEVKASERYIDDLAATAKLLESGSTSPASTVRKPRGKKNVGS